MRKAYLSWPALLLSPTLALGNLIITFALVTPACANQQHGWLHIVTACSIVVSLVFTLMAAYANAINLPPSVQPNVQSNLEVNVQLNVSPKEGSHLATDESATRPHFLTSMSLWSGIFFSATIVAEWLGQWLLSPCI